MITVFVTIPLLSQHKINNYKYIIIPEQFEFLNKPDQHQTSSLTKFLFNKNGYRAFLTSDEFPEDFAKDRCLALEVSVKKKSTFFNIKTILELKDCFDNVVFTSNEGVSKQKNYKKAYHEAIRKSFNSIKRINYKYVPLNKIEKKSPETNTVTVKTPTVKVNTTKGIVKLYAQPKEYGFQIVDTKPEVVFKALKTSIKNVYILKDKKGILYKNDNKWFVEYYLDGKKVIQQYQIKF